VARARDAAGDAGDWLDRHQVELAPLVAALLVVGVASLGHLLASRWWPLFGLAGLVVATIWARSAPRAWWAQTYGLLVGVVATAIVTSGVAYGVQRQAWLVLLAVAAVVFGLPWGVVQHRRGRVALARPAALPAVAEPATVTGEVLEPETAPEAPRRSWWDIFRGSGPDGSGPDVEPQAPAPEPEPNGELLAMAERTKAIIDGWELIANEVGLKRVVIQSWDYDEHGMTLRARLPVGTIPERVAGRLRELDGAFQVRRGATRIEPVPERADLVVVRVNVHDPLDPPRPWPGPIDIAPRAPIALGPYEDNKRATAPLINAHWLLSGPTGAGKSFAQRVILAALVTRPSVVTWGVDVAKAGVQFSPYEPALDWLVTEHEEAVRMLRALLALQRARARWMRSEGLTEWPVSPEHPQLVVVFDEVSNLMTIPGVPELLEECSKLVREQGATLIMATQSSTGAALGDSVVLRRQLTVRIGMKSRERDDKVFDTGMAAAGWRTDRLTLRGSFLLWSDDQQTPLPGRFYLMQSDEAVRVAAGAASARTRLDDVSTAAVAPYRAPGEAAVDLSGPAPVEALSRRRGKVTAADRVLAKVVEAGPEGIAPAELEDALDGAVSRAQIYRVLGEKLEPEGLVEQLEDGRYAAVEARS
jgi:hypothetical protein